jgi:hypothetical protein
MSGSQVSKRQRSDDGRAIVRTGLAIPQQATAHGLRKCEVYKELHKWDNEATPYGPLYTNFECHGIQFDSLNPFAFLWLAAKLDDSLGAFFEQHLSGKTCRLAFYCDGVKPGNVLRPDLGRSFEAVYWTFMEFPDYFRSRCAFGWLPLCFLPCIRVQQLPAGMSSIAKEILKLFFSPDRSKFNFETTGLILQVAGRDVHLRGRFGCWLADEKAIKEIVHCKGASGLKPCVCCKNVVNRVDVAEGEYLVYSE